MVDRANTGGLKTFVYGKSPKIDSELSKKIDEGYARAAERKRKEKIRRIIIWSIVILVVVIGGAILAIN